MTSGSTHPIAPTPTWLDSLLFLALMSGPPKFRGRDLTASLAGEIDMVVLIQVGVWACGGLWVLARLYPPMLRRGTIPFLNAAQVTGALFIGALSLSLWQSPGFLLTGFVLGQFAVMLSFAWVFTHRFGPSIYVRHLFVGVCGLLLMVAGAAFIAPDLVFVGESSRLRGDYITSPGHLAVIGLVLCLSNTPALKSPMFWGATGCFGLLLAASQTRTCYVALLVYLAIGYVHGKGLRVRKLVPLLAALVLTLLLLEAFSPMREYIVRDPQSVETMSDRRPLWEHLSSTVLREAPLTGLGYYAASRVLAPQYNEHLGNAHSVFLEILVGGGVLGAALYLALCASLLLFAVRLLSTASGRPEAVAAVGLLLVTIVFGLTSSAVNAGPVGFTFWSLTALIPAMWRHAAGGVVFGSDTSHVREGLLRARAAVGPFRYRVSRAS